EGGQVPADLLPELRRQEPPDDGVVVDGVDGEVPQPAALEELIEDVGPQDDRGRDGDLDLLEPVPDPVLVKEEVHEGEAPRLPSEGPAADPGEAAGGVEGVPVEVGDGSPDPLLPVFADRLDQLAAEILRGGEVGDLPRPQPMRQREFGPRLEPVGEV